MQAEMSPQIDLLRYALGVEELALSFFLIGQPQFGLNTLAAVYENLEQTQVDFASRVAGHSLLARGLCELDAEGKLVIEKQFGSILNLMVEYDDRLQVKYVGEDDNGVAHIHIHTGKVFATHYTRQQGFVNYVEYGLMGEFPRYILSMFPSFGLREVGQEAVDFSRVLEKTKIYKALQEKTLDLSVNGELNDSNEQKSWTPFAADLADAEYVVGLLQMGEEEARTPSELYMIRGKESWLVKSNGNTPNEMFEVATVNQIEFLTALEKLLG